MTTPTVVPAVGEAELRTLWATANAIVASKVHRREVFTAEEAFARILAGRDLGLAPTDAIHHMHLIDGRFVPSAEIQLAMLKRYVGPDGTKYDLKVMSPQTRRNEECKVAVFRREPGADWEKLGTETFTLEDAREQDLGGEFWDRIPRRMLFWRAVTNAIDTFAPDVLHPERGPVATIDDPQAPKFEGELPPLPIASDPMDGIRVGDPNESATSVQAQHILRHHDHLKARGRLGRLVAVLDQLGAPEHEDPAQRALSLDENKATELLMRLGPTPGPIGDDDYRRINAA